jgi:hypothetical protein
MLSLGQILQRRGRRDGLVAGVRRRHWFSLERRRRRGAGFVGWF